MQNQLLVSIAAIAVAAAGMGMGTFAYFSDTEESDGNLFSAATVNLERSGLDGAAIVFSGNDFWPGENATGSVDLSSEGSDSTTGSGGLRLDIGFNVTGSGLETMAADLDIDALAYGLQDLIALGETCWTSASVPATVADLDNNECVGLAEPGGAATPTAFSTTISYNTGAEDQGQTVTIDITFFLRQAAEVPLDV